MNKITLVILVLMVIVVASFWVFITNNAPKVYKPGIWPEADQAVSQSKHFYAQAKEKGVDLSSGPCLSNALSPGWALDIVHNPRVAIDNIPENQCQAYLEGQADHIVELDLDGNLVKVK